MDHHQNSILSMSIANQKEILLQDQRKLETEKDWFEMQKWKYENQK